ncbi:MAG TPA: nitronate monooxygenase, partial [Novosphingobium sp.]|nr:nitronate monooxygenase [Novosphingobium sp.]
AEVLGADLAYVGTRFIATCEARAPEAYKQMLIAGGAEDLRYSPGITGVNANWLAASLERCGVDLEALGAFSRDYAHLPPDIRPWRDVWSAGQGVELIEDCPDAASLVARLRREYVAACAVPDLAASARQAEPAL